MPLADKGMGPRHGLVSPIDPNSINYFSQPRKSWAKPSPQFPSDRLKDLLMPLEILFKTANYVVLPFWLLLVAAPRWRWTQLLVHGPAVVLLLTPIYAYMLFGYGASRENIDMTSLYGVMTAFTAPHLVVAGWIHYLIFDLFIGAWESRDAARLNIPHLLVIPCLLATLLVGPVGLLLYVIIRFIARRVIQYDETVSAGSPSP